MPTSPNSSPLVVWKAMPRRWVRTLALTCSATRLSQPERRSFWRWNSLTALMPRTVSRKWLCWLAWCTISCSVARRRGRNHRLRISV